MAIAPFATAVAPPAAGATSDGILINGCRASLHLGYLQELLRDMGGQSVHGKCNGINFELENGGGIVVGLGQTYSSDEPEGVYVSARLPQSLMADLLLESQQNVSSCDDPLEPFSWSGTSEEWVREQLRGPLLELIGVQNRYRQVRLTDEVLRIGPLPRNVDAAAETLDEILAGVQEHFAEK